MDEQTVLAQTPGPPPIILPFPGSPPGVSLLPAHNQLTMGEADGGLILFQANGKTCLAPKYINFDKLKMFFEKCPKEKFLSSDHPDCSCGAYNASYVDYGLLEIKSGGWFYHAYGNGALYPFLLFTIAAVALIIICTPFVYFFSYRMSRRELQESERETFFFQWHQQRLSSLICLIMVSFGFILLLLGISGNSQINVFGLFQISTSLPGVIFALLGFMTWRIILTRRPDRPAKKIQAKART